MAFADENMLTAFEFAEKPAAVNAGATLVYSTRVMDAFKEYPRAVSSEVSRAKPPRAGAAVSALSERLGRAPIHSVEADHDQGISL
jgi:hypothetical protein